MLENIDYLDVFLEGAKVISMLILLVVISNSAKKYPQLAGRGWPMIKFGFVLMFVGFAFDFSDELIDYEASDLADTIQSFIEEAGLIGGLVIATIGFGRWFTFVSRFLGLKQAE